MHDPKGKLFYLDLKPDKIVHPDGSFHHRKALRRLGPKECFKDDHLYTLFFGEHATDIIEKNFFGPIDNIGSDLLDFFSDYSPSDKAVEGFQNFLRYVDAQKIRTPKGIDFLKKAGLTSDHQQALGLMQSLWQAHCTIWTEGVWEILSCDNSPTKFIVTDHPVTTYNKGLFPGAKACTYPLDAPVSFLGTHTIFPLNLNRCLVITNLGYVRNPGINPLKERENPRYYANTMFDIRTVQTGRQIDEDYVLAINYILKNRARRYVAAAQESWLYPERKLKTRHWSKLGGKVFLMPDPRKVSFSTQVLVGYKDGSAWGQDEYGRQSKDDDPKVKKLRDKEWDAHQRAKNAWDSMFGPLDREDWIKYM
ncbi:MAG: DUF4238 domain-containing protein [Candidatus Thiodiazotropha endolucinida]|nr:DUF4238 domain-containing protein [Candidatus Thiodiazotropha taylori]